MIVGYTYKLSFFHEDPSASRSVLSNSDTRIRLVIAKGNQA